MIFVLMTTVPGCMEGNLEKLDVEFDSTGTNIESFMLISTNGESLSHSQINLLLFAFECDLWLVFALQNFRVDPIIQPDPSKQSRQTVR